MKHIFVYGSLRKGMYNYDKYLKGHSTLIGYGYVKGTLYSLKNVPYPALLVGADDILGEIYEIEEALLKDLDALEDYVPNDPNNAYNRIVSNICMQDGSTIILPVYFFNLSKEENRKQLDKKIKENDFVTYLKQ